MHADRLVQTCQRGRRGDLLGQHPGALHAPGEVAVAEVEPYVVSELAQAVHDGEGVIVQSPAALVDQIGEPERHEVGIGRDVRAVDLDVVTGVGDHRQVLGRVDRIGHAPRELGAAGAPGEDHDISMCLSAFAHRIHPVAHCGQRGRYSQEGSDRPARRMPAWTL